jgi:hypothetical protein
MESGLSLGDLAGSSQIYPTYARVIRDLATQFQATRRERGFVQTALRFFYGFQPRPSATGLDVAGAEAPATTTPNGSQAEEDHATEPAGVVHGLGH